MGGVGEKIMVGALTGVMGAVLGKLTKLMGEEYAMLRSVRKKLDSLTKELIAIHAFLVKYSAIEEPDVQARAWTNEVRELAYDIEDSIDLFTYHVVRKRADNTTGAKRFLRKALRKVKKLEHRHKFAKQIQELQSQVNEVYKRRVRYNLDEGTSSNMHMETDPRLKALYVEVEKLVGIEGPSEEIISRFIGEKPTKQRKVVSIVGPGGLGKTTLAKQVYEKIKGQGQFKCTAFVSVSQKPNISNLLREIESCLGISEPWISYSDQQVIDKVKARLENTKYLIVIDDIWEKSAWETIQCALPKNGHASRIITTTRINNVAESCCTSNEDFVYRMKPLSRSDSTNLFLKRIFDAEDKCPDHLEGIMKEILHKCDGLPLAIVTLASLLANKPRRKEEWERVLNSIRSIDEKDKELQVMDKILALSYSDLPRNLKNCLLYLSTFPEDHWIGKDILVWRWIAEGFITAKQDYPLEEIGESYFNELINRSLIQPMEDYAYRRIEVCGCRVHDIVLNFIISRSTEENFVTVLDSQDRSSSHKRIRRLSIWHNKEHAEAISQGTMDLSHLRSLNICRVVGWTMPPVLDLPFLRVLDLEDCRELRNVHLDGIVGLFHLQYLGLRGPYITRLPVQIGKLEYLQTLDLRSTSISELPGSIVQLKRLVRLVGDDLILPDGFGSMEALQELGTIDAYRSSVKDLQFLSKLRVLRVIFRYEGIRDLHTRKESLESSLCKLGASNLRSLHINDRLGGAYRYSFTDSWCPSLLQKFVTEFWNPKFPKCITPSLSDLTCLDIRVEEMEGEDLRLLQDLPALLFLGLDVKQVPEDGLRISPGGFRCLTELTFYNKDGPGLIFEGALPKLERLVLGFDADKAQSTYGSLHIGIQHLTSLKDIWMRVWVFSEDENTPTMKAAQSAINDQVKMLPNHPTLDIKILRADHKDERISDSLRMVQEQQDITWVQEQQDLFPIRRRPRRRAGRRQENEEAIALNTTY